MDEIILYKSKWKAVRLALLVVPFVGFGIYDLTNHTHQLPALIEWISILFFGLGIPIGIYNLLDRTAQVIINETGIFVKSEYHDFINWEAIEHAYWRTIRRQRFVCLIIKEDFKRLIKPKSELKATSIALRNYDIAINLSVMRNVDQEKLTALIINLSNAEPTQRHQMLTTKLITP